MGKKVKEKEESKLVSTPRIFPMDEVEYVHEFVSQYIAMTRIEYVAHDGNESEWDNVVINVFKSFYSDLQTGIEGLSTIIAPKEKGLDISTINFKDFEINLAEYYDISLPGSYTFSVAIGRLWCYPHWRTTNLGKRDILLRQSSNSITIKVRAGSK